MRLQDRLSIFLVVLFVSLIAAVSFLVLSPLCVLYTFVKAEAESLADPAMLSRILDIVDEEHRQIASSPDLRAVENETNEPRAAEGLPALPPPPKLRARMAIRTLISQLQSKRCKVVVIHTGRAAIDSIQSVIDPSTRTSAHSSAS